MEKSYELYHFIISAELLRKLWQLWVWQQGQLRMRPRKRLLRQEGFRKDERLL